MNNSDISQSNINIRESFSQDQRSSSPIINEPILLEPGTILSEFHPCTSDELRIIINESGTKVSPSDPLPSSILKECLEEVLPYLVVLVNSSLRSGTVDGIKDAIVRPLLKKAGLDHNCFKNYRPISNLSFISKVVERVVLKRLNAHLDLNNLQCHSQYGYKKNHGTETLLIHFLDEILVAVDKNLGVVVLLVDLSAAFDTVNHDILLRILSQEIGIKGTALTWFRSFLTGRTQRVSIDGYLSEPIHLKFGVPQGSVLGPILFNIYTRSIYKVFSSAGFSSAGYADDNSGLCAFSLHSEFDILINQVPECLSMLRSWMDQHFLKLNESKTEVIIFGSGSCLNNNIIGGTILSSGHCLRFSSIVKYLGVTFDNYINFDKHITNISSLCYLFIRNLSSFRKFLSQKECEIVVHAFISSKLDSCNALLFGASRNNIKKLQRVQNAAMRIIKYKKKSESVRECFLELHWLNIDQRISFKILLIVYKCIHRLAPVSLQSLIKIRHPETLILETNYFPLSNIGRRAFVFFAPRQWNSLPNDLRRQALLLTTESFKSHLKTYLFGCYQEFCGTFNKYNKLSFA